MVAPTSVEAAPLVQVEMREEIVSFPSDISGFLMLCVITLGKGARPALYQPAEPSAMRIAICVAIATPHRQKAVMPPNMKIRPKRLNLSSLLMSVPAVVAAAHFTATSKFGAVAPSSSRYSVPLAWKLMLFFTLPSPSFVVAVSLELGI